MNLECELLARTLLKWRIPAVSLLMIMMMKIVLAQYSWVQPYDEVSIGYKIEPSSPSIDQVLITEPDSVIFYSAHFRNCNVMDIKMSTRGGPTRDKPCMYLGRSRFHATNLQPDTEYLLHLHRKGRSLSLIKIPFKTPKEDAAPPGVPWHYVAGTGPGWIDLRWSAAHPIPNHLVTYKVEHWMHTQGEDPVLSYHAYPMLSHVDLNGEIMPRIKPALPCPQWKTYDIYCLILTGMVFTRHFHYNDFHDYVVKITAYRVHMEAPGRSYPILDRPSVPYICVIRSWDCDTTIGACPKLMRSIGFHREYTKEPTERGRWGKGDQMKYMYPSNEPSFEVVTSNVTAMESGYLHPDTVVTLRRLWPLFLILCLLILLIVLPFAFYAYKRNTRDRVISNWYGWASPDGRVNYAVAMPERSTHLAPMTQEAYDQRQEELAERQRLQDSQRPRTEGQQPKGGGGGGGGGAGSRSAP